MKHILPTVLAAAATTVFHYHHQPPPDTTLLSSPSDTLEPPPKPKLSRESATPFKPLTIALFCLILSYPLFFSLLFCISGLPSSHPRMSQVLFHILQPLPPYWVGDVLWLLSVG
ncbi:hypothetical protein L2E82_20105 [Cichorium intybus]|uniref:Uncharacterized protein n=1 Tax=Cichorium intybus TaxID=13427 RepID=A0ACB9DSF4_CICIN|nr:hypothetical protein L2E82_20105 [Cichorium intybus]